MRQAGRELGARYVLEGSVRKAGNRIRITAQLIDAETGTHVWAERYDRAIEDIFAVQDEITLILATEMQVNLTEGEQARMRYSSTSNVEAWNSLGAGPRAYRSGVVTKDGVGKARVYWEKALALDPNSASLHAMLGFMHNTDARFGWWDDRATAIAKSKGYLARALELDPDNADAHLFTGMILNLERRFDDSVASARRAIALAPGSADVAAFAAAILASAGVHDEAIVQIEKAMRLSPKLPANYLGIQGLVYRLAGRTDDAIAAFKAYQRTQPGLRPCRPRDHLRAGRPARGGAGGDRETPRRAAELLGRQLRGHPIPQGRRGGRGRYRGAPRGGPAGVAHGTSPACRERVW